MVDTTQKQEALQAVRLLFVAACGGGSSDHKNPETLYRARQMLEKFIESAGVLESTEPEIEFEPGQRVWMLMWTSLTEAYKRYGTVAETKGGLVRVEFDDKQVPSLLKTWMLHGEYDE